MIVVDANLLMYAYLRASPFHRAAKFWWEEVLSGTDLVAVPLQCASAFVRITTHPRFSLGAVPLESALGVVDRWLAEPNVKMLYPGNHHWPLFRRALIEGKARGDMSSDAHLAALTMEYGGILHTSDRDFARFPGLRWINPLAA